MNNLSTANIDLESQKSTEQASCSYQWSENPSTNEQFVHLSASNFDSENNVTYESGKSVNLPWI